MLSTNLEAENKRLVAALELKEAENKRLVKELRAATILTDSLKEEVHKSGQSSNVDKTTKVIQTNYFNV